MKHDEKIKWMTEWAKKNNVTLTLKGECGLGQKCVGIIAENNNHHPTSSPQPDIAVLGWGEEAESQFYEWLKWFNDSLTVLKPE